MQVDDNIFGSVPHDHDEASLLLLRNAVLVCDILQSRWESNVPGPHCESKRGFASHCNNSACKSNLQWQHGDIHCFSRHIGLYTTRRPPTSSGRTSPHMKYANHYPGFVLEWRQRPSALVEKSEKLPRKPMDFVRQFYAIPQPYDDFICSSPRRSIGSRGHQKSKCITILTVFHR